jgi:hypothetical protein
MRIVYGIMLLFILALFGLLFMQSEKFEVANNNTSAQDEVNINKIREYYGISDNEFEILKTISFYGLRQLIGITDDEINKLIEVLIQADASNNTEEEVIQMLSGKSSNKAKFLGYLAIASNFNSTIVKEFKDTVIAYMLLRPSTQAPPTPAPDPFDQSAYNTSYTQPESNDADIGTDAVMPGKNYYYSINQLIRKNY